MTIEKALEVGRQHREFIAALEPDEALTGERLAKYRAEQARDTAGLDALLHAVEHPWQPIATAPKDGTWIVVVGEIYGDAPTFRGYPRACVTRWFSEADHKDSPAWTEGWFYCAPGYSSTIQPTHWMPLPGDTK